MQSKKSRRFAVHFLKNKVRKPFAPWGPLEFVHPCFMVAKLVATAKLQVVTHNKARLVQLFPAFLPNHVCGIIKKGYGATHLFRA